MRSKRFDDKQIHTHTHVQEPELGKWVRREVRMKWSQKGNEKLKQKEGELALLKVKSSEFVEHPVIIGRNFPAVKWPPIVEMSMAG